MPTRLAHKSTLALAVGLLFVPTLGTRSARASGIDRLERDAGEGAFVPMNGQLLSKAWGKETRPFA